MASGAPGANFRPWTPTPPERGSFPLDHDGECSSFMENYLKCMKFTENKNAPNCRILAKQYLKCRMDHQLMEESNWESLGLVNLPGEKHVDIRKKYAEAEAEKNRKGDDSTTK